MSADAWGVCPICQNLPEEWRKGIDYLYGDIPLKEFKVVEEEYNKLKQIETVREDYEVGLNNDGTAYVSFLAVCEACGAEWVYSKKNIHASNLLDKQSEQQCI